MADAKPVAGASEPHELEEMAVKAMQKAMGSFAMGPVMTLLAVQAVLRLVRQEQEKDDHRIEDNGIHRWWLSHTAKETSNG